MQVSSEEPVVEETIGEDEPESEENDDGIGTVLLIVGNTFDEREFGTIVGDLEAAGYRVLIGSETLETLVSEHISEVWPIYVEPDIVLTDVVVSDYDGFILLDDFDLTGYPSTHPEAHVELTRILQEAAVQGKVIAATGKATICLVYAEVVEGVEITSDPLSCSMLLMPNHGIDCQSANVHRDGQFVTSRGRAFSMTFVDVLIETLQDQ